MNNEPSIKPFAVIDANGDYAVLDGQLAIFKTEDIAKVTCEVLTVQMERKLYAVPVCLLAGKPKIEEATS